MPYIANANRYYPINPAIDYHEHIDEEVIENALIPKLAEDKLVPEKLTNLAKDYRITYINGGVLLLLFDNSDIELVVPGTDYSEPELHFNERIPNINGKVKVLADIPNTRVDLVSSRVSLVSLEIASMLLGYFVVPKVTKGRKQTRKLCYRWEKF